MELNFNKSFLSIKGEKQPSTIGELFADVLATENHKDSLKLYGIATKLAQNETIDLDKADFKLLEDLATNNGRMVVLLKAQILEVFEEAREAEKEKEKADRIRKDKEKSKKQEEAATL